MNFPKIKAIIFDCDGTLVNSEAPTASLITEILINSGHITTYDEILAISRGQKLAILAKILGKRFNGIDETLFIQAYNAQILEKLRVEIAPNPATISLLDNLPLEICIATNGSRERTEIVLSASKLLPFFKNRIVSAYDINAWKPDPKIILHSANLIGVLPEECLLIDDSIDGLKAGLGAGAQVVAFNIPDEKLGELRKSVTQINELNEILNLI